ncbi:hypothetical protein BC936DRAFT_142789 [Jimgerdemannia flammicorona]|uniref:Methyltransferase type 11 domain-containing protein n=1 Tax=Jimgerdemannia flammicorona TaxID=994334 RepID=A0A433A0B2_9FUNG|nr:hypothetical protein BC936DRAFT_142789 [Jimgerdemannia flammicorona]
MANTHPASEFTAADIVDTFSDSISSAPANLNFLVANTRDLPFPDNHFDFVYQAMSMASFREREWPSVIRELVRVTKPGGWVELFDAMMSMRDVNLNYLFLKEDALEEAGLENIGRVIQSIPMGWGPVEIAEQSLMHFILIWPA